jgi:hypothetical protein
MLTKQQDYIHKRPALRQGASTEMTAGSPTRSSPGGRDGPGSVDDPAQWARERVAAVALVAEYTQSGSPGMAGDVPDIR